MDRNFVLACALSLAVITGWMYLTGGANQQSQPGVNPPTQAEPADPIGEYSQPTADQAAIARSVPQAAVQAGQPDRIEIAEQLIPIETPIYSAVLTNRGAGILSWKLNEFRETSEPAAPRINLVTGMEAGKVSLATPFTELGIGDFANRVFEVVSEDGSSVSFEASENGVTLRKTFTFEPEDYSFRLLVEVLNESTDSVAPRFQIDIPAYHHPADDFREQALAALQDGSRVAKPIQGLGGGGFFQSITGGKPEKYEDFVGPIDWAGVQTTYFLTAIVPDNPSQAQVRMAALEPRVSGVAQLSFAETVIPAGRSVAREFRGFMGPKEMERLEAFGGGTVHAIDLGWSWVEPLTRIFSMILKMLYSVVGNYGVAIVILTIMVRVVTAPLTVKQMRSMERMRALSPKLKEIQAEFSDDRQKQSEKTMALYKSEGVNPLGGCLPMLLQFPVFIGLFYALRSTIQLRQAPFFGWIDDLSVPESLFQIPVIDLPFRVLPLIMGASMVLQQRITPTQADPAQAKMMMTVMPIMMTVIFYQFPSGLVLYWMVSNILAISHQ
ncbi:MAG: membrane protein insertase YidC, partial [Deltaproteobacteria bacterium]|nr:membrane protein insertase YidC [Deltaproteobacteria bacterium]